MGVLSKATVFAALIGACVASDVIVGTTDNFASEVAEGVALAEFYAPWCGHCKKLTPEWESAATTLQGKAKLIKVDATVETELASKYEVQGYPTIKAFINGGDAMEYDGGRTAADIVAWVSKMTGPAVKDVADAAALEELKGDNNVLVVGYFGSAEDAEAKTFANVASANRANHVFASVFDKDMATAEGVTAPALVVFKKFDGKKDVMAKFEDDFLPFVKSASFPLFEEIGPDNYKSYVDRGLPLGWLFVDPADEEKTQIAKDAVTAVAESLKGKISLVWLSGPQYGQMAGRVGLSGKVWPSFGIDDQGEHFAFDESVDFSAEGLAAWTAQWAEGALSATMKSDETPEQATVDGVTTIVGNTFKSIVFDEKKDVFIKFYAPWCGHCKSMIPAYEQLGKTFEDNENIVIAKFDATTNDAPKGFDVQGFPTLKFVKAGTNEIVDYSGSREFDGMEEFIKANAAELN